MAIARIASAHVAQTGPSGGGALTEANATAIDTTGADFLVYARASWASVAAITPIDNKSNTLNALTSYDNADSRFLLYYSSPAPTVGSGHKLYTSGAGAYPGVAWAAYSGVKQTSPFDAQVGNNTNTSGTTLQASSALTPAEDGELLYMAGVAGALGADDSFDVGSLLDRVDGTGGDPAYGLIHQDEIQTTATSRQPTHTTGSAFQWRSMSVAAFKAAATSTSWGRGLSDEWCRIARTA